MTTQFSSRAALCRQLAKQEPANRALWIAEAENWLRLEGETSRRGKGRKIGFVVLASLRSRRTRYLSISASPIQTREPR
jgi:hypothetical protein